MSLRKPTHSDIYDVDPSGAVVLGSNRLDDYATTVLQKYCPQALTTPMPLPVEDMVQAEGLSVVEARLSESLDAFACCMLVDGTVTIYNEDRSSSTSVEYPQGTIVVDPETEWTRGAAFKRAVLMHELLHWHKDRTFFQIKAMKHKTQEKDEPVLATYSESMKEPSSLSKKLETRLEWIEWQNHKLTPRILMPKAPFAQLATQYLAELQGEEKTCKNLVNRLAEFFQTTKISTKYRLLEVGMKKQLEDLTDFEDVFSLTSNDESHNWTPLSTQAALELLHSGTRLSQRVKAGNYIFVDGYFVLNDTRYVRINNKGIFTLTPLAKKNKSACILNIQRRTVHNYSLIEEDLKDLPHLWHTVASQTRVDYFNPRAQAKQRQHVKTPVYANQAIDPEAYEKQRTLEIEQHRIIADPELTTTQIICQLLELAGIRYSATFRDRTFLHERYFNRYQKGENIKLEKNTVMALCVGMNLSYDRALELFEACGIKLHEFQEPDRLYRTILQRFPEIDIVTVNDILERRGHKTLGTNSRT